MKIINISNFINKFITKRSKSFFESDILKYNSLLEKEIFNKSVLVIGGAGTIGSSFIKSILNFKPNKVMLFIKGFPVCLILLITGEKCGRERINLEINSNTRTCET